MKFSKKLFLFIFFVFLLCSVATKVEAKQVDAPIVLETGEQQTTELSNQLYLKGLTTANTEVLIYIDGTYVNLAEISEENVATNSFYYEHAVALSEGVHTILVIAQDKSSLILSPPVEIEFTVVSLPAPTLLELNESGGNLVIKGLTVSASLVYFYIDGNYYGKTKILEHESGTAGFIYSPDFKITSDNHKVWVIAENEQGRKSIKSNLLTLGDDEVREDALNEAEVQDKTILPTPLPILYAPVVNSESSYNQPFIVGLARNNLDIKIYIDEDLAGQFTVENHKSGTANFAFKPTERLNRGQHTVFAIAIDSTGKESKLSNIIDFTVNKPTIAQSAQEDKQNTVAEIKAPVVVESESPLVVFPDVSEDTAEQLIQDEIISNDITDDLNEDSIDKEIERIINEPIVNQVSQTGSVDESEKGQGRLSLNLAIFLVFLFGVIAWIFWVNKELIKERNNTLDVKEDEKLNKDNSDNMSDKLF